MNIIKLSWKNILAKPLNSLMSILLFALSIGLITFLILFNDQFKKGLDNNLAGIDLVIGAKGSPLQLILNSMYHIDAPTGNISLSEVAPFLNPEHPLVARVIPLSLGDSYGAFRIVGAPPSILTLYDVDKIKGDLYEKDFDAVVGHAAADKLNLRIGDNFHSTHGLDDNPDLLHDHITPFVVTGLLEQSGTVLDQLILTNPQTIWKVHEHGSTSQDHNHPEDHAHNEIRQPVSLPLEKIDTLEIQSFSDIIIDSLRANPEREITSVLIRYKNRTSIQSLNLSRNINQNTGMMAASPAWEINRLYAMMGSGADAIRYLAMLIAIVAAISIFISLYTSLKDRRYEMALMRVSGAGPAKIFQMILGEGLWISILGMIMGLISGHTGIFLAGKILERGYRYQFTGLTWVPEEIWIIAGSLIISILASLLPAIQGSRTDLHKTLAEG